MSGRSDALKRRRIVAWASAPAFLLALLLVRERVSGGLPFLAAAVVGPIAAVRFLVVFLRARKRDDQLPEPGPLLAWGAAAAMELHALLPPVARTGIVPAALFFSLGMTLPPFFSIPSILCAGAWMAAMSPPFGEQIVSISAMALIAGGGGVVLRGRIRDARKDGNSVHAAVARSRAMVLPWEDSAKEDPLRSGEVTEESSLLRREADLKEGIFQALVRLRTLTGASHVAYVSRSISPGSALADGFLLGADAPGTRPIAVCDTYEPLREATVFGKPFLEVGHGARRYALPEIDALKSPEGVAAVPVSREGCIEGVLLAFRNEEGPWRDPVIPAMELAGYFVGREIDRTRELHRGDRYYLHGEWYQRLVRKMSEAGADEVPGTGGEMRSRRESVYAEIVEEARRQVAADRVLLVESGEEPGRGRIAWESTRDGAGPGPEDRVPLGDSYLGWVIRTGTHRIFPGAGGSPNGEGVLPGPWERDGERSFLVLPVDGRVGFRGALVCAHPEERRFRKWHAEVLRDIARVMQLGISHIERIESLTKKASTDGLTGLSNRKAFLERLESDLARSDGRYPCGVVMLDIDHFKRINDTFGHPFGDEVLRGVASVLTKGVRKGDAAGRYGGEEFVLYLHMADSERAREGAERFRRMIRRIRFTHAGKEIVVTASFGVACAPQHGKGPEELLKRADEALYLSKERGRDQVTVYPG